MLADANADDVLGLSVDAVPQISARKDKPVPWDYHEDELLKACFDFLAFFVLKDKENQHEFSDEHHIETILRCCAHGIHAEKMLNSSQKIEFSKQ